MLPTLRSLTRRHELELRLLTPEGALPADALDVPIEWVHSSDLADPTPFLAPGQVLLTTGTQFEQGAGAVAAPGDALFADYVARLLAAGVAGLGFGTEVVRAGTPDALVEACAGQGLPLFEVPYRTPFIAVARAAADMASEQRFARHTWSLRAQRAIALAALRPDGLSASLNELAQQLGQWVALFDANGALDRVFPAEAAAAASTAEQEAQRLVRRGQRAGSSITVGADTLVLQTLGRREQLRGVLVIGGSADFDQSSNEVVTAVIALAGLALEQHHALDRARGSLRGATLQLLRGGETELARAVSAEIWGALPVEPVRCAVLGIQAGQLDAVTDALEARVGEWPGRVFFAVDGERVVLCLAEQGVPELHTLCAALGLRAGLSEPAGYAELERAGAQAEQALARGLEAARGGRPGPAVSAFGDVALDGVLGYLGTTDARQIGLAVLRPLSEHDAAHGTELLETLRLWLEQNGQIERAALLLGVHRHTVRARIAQAEKLLGRDLGDFRQRAELWAALLVAGSTRSG